MKKIIYLTGVSRLIFGLVLAVGCQTFIQPCIHEDGSYGKCHTAGQVLTVLGVVLAILALGHILSAGKIKRQKYISLGMAVIALVTAFVPGKIVSLCMMSSMRCVSVMRPAAILIAGLITILSAVDIALCMKRQ